MVSAVTARSQRPWLGKRWAKNAGTVSAPSAALVSRSGRATKRQLHQVPARSPAAVQAAAAGWLTASPGSPSSSQPLMSEAPALSAATQGPMRRPPSR